MSSKRATAGVLVVGGGIAGLSLLFELSRLGAKATLIERGAIAAQGASSLPAAVLNPQRGRTGRAKALDLEGLAASWRLVATLEAAGLTTGASRSGVLRLASSARQAALWRALPGPEWGALHGRAWRALHGPEWGALPGPQWLEPGEVQAPFHAPYGGMLVPAGGWVEGPTLLRALAAASLQLGAEVREGVALLGATGRSGRMVAETDQGAIAADEVILCPGAYAQSARLPTLERAAGGAVRLRMSAPLAAATAGRTLPPLAGATCAVFLEGSVLITGGTAPAESGECAASGPPPGLSQAAAERLRDSLAWFLPAIAGAPIEATWSGVRLRRPSGNPVVRRLRSGLTLFTALGGRGFLCGPLLAGRLALRLAGGLGSAARRHAE